MGVLTVCLTCWLIFVAETTGEEPGQVVLTRIVKFNQILISNYFDTPPEQITTVIPYHFF